MSKNMYLVKIKNKPLLNTHLWNINNCDKWKKLNVYPSILRFTPNVSNKTAINSIKLFEDNLVYLRNITIKKPLIFSNIIHHYAYVKIMTLLGKYNNEVERIIQFDKDNMCNFKKIFKDENMCNDFIDFIMNSTINFGKGTSEQINAIEETILKFPELLVCKHKIEHVNNINKLYPYMFIMGLIPCKLKHILSLTIRFEKSDIKNTATGFCLRTLARVNFNVPETDRQGYEISINDKTDQRMLIYLWKLCINKKRKSDYLLELKRSSINIKCNMILLSDFINMFIEIKDIITITFTSFDNLNNNLAWQIGYRREIIDKFEYIYKIQTIANFNCADEFKIDVDHLYKIENYYEMYEDIEMQYKVFVAVLKRKKQEQQHKIYVNMAKTITDMILDE